MTDDPYHSFEPVVNTISGVLVAVVFTTLPIFLVLSDRVKSTHEPTPLIHSGENVEAGNVKRQNIRRLTLLQ